MGWFKMAQNCTIINNVALSNPVVLFTMYLSFSNLPDCHILYDISIQNLNIRKYVEN